MTYCPQFSKISNLILNFHLDGVSVGIQNSEGNIVGVCLNGFLRPGEILKAKESLEKCQDESFKKIFNLLYNENLKFDLFEMHKVDKIFEYRILSVDKDYRGKGLAKKLIERSEDVARKYHCRIVKGDATAKGSLAICLGQGLQPITEVYYKDTEFEVKSPHEKFVILYKILDKE
jgi:GNAT superfamily N-acetyltransferase